jgi:hypothetical protein
MATKDISTVTAVDLDNPSTDEKVSSNELSPAESQNEDSDVIDPTEERAFVWRLDLWFLTIGFLGYAFKYLDQTNISNAYVSGMKEDLHLYGNQLNYFTRISTSATW